MDDVKKMINRRGLITGLIAFGCAPAIVRAESLMKVKVIKPEYTMRLITDYFSDPDIAWKFHNGIQWCKYEIDKVTGLRTVTWLNSEDVYVSDNGRVTIT